MDNGDDPPPPPPDDDDGRQLKIFKLQYASAMACANVLRELFDGQVIMAVDERINAIIVRARARELQAVEALVQQLDQSAPKTQRQSNAFPMKPGGLQSSDDANGKPPPKPAPTNWPAASAFPASSRSLTNSSTTCAANSAVRSPKRLTPA